MSDWRYWREPGRIGYQTAARPLARPLAGPLAW
jgi:hypothetical protein